jgi:hypothetical protein
VERSSLDEFVAAGPWPVRPALRVLVPLARRPRARALLGLLAGADQALESVAAMGHYDQPTVARSLGWDAETVIARGRELRRTEGRP